MRFKNRLEAGQLLAKKLAHFSAQKCVVLALPRGGVVTAGPIALALRAPLDLLLVRKVGHPSSPEYAIAAVTEDGHVFKNESEVAAVDPAWFAEEVAKQTAEAQRRRKAYLGDTPPVEVKGAVAVVVDDGVATGLTLKAALAQLRHRAPKKIIVAVPVAPADSLPSLRELADEVVVLEADDNFLGAIGAYYDDFPQVSDEEVTTLLRQIREAGRQ